MKWIKRISKILASLLVIVNCAIYFDYNPKPETYSRIAHTELFVFKEDFINKVVKFETAQQLRLSLNFTNENIGKGDWESKIPKIDSKNMLDFKIQSRTSLGFKSSLLNILLNESIQQKSHWI